MSDCTGMSAAELGRGIAAGSIDPVALAQTFLDRIAAHPLRDRIYARVTPERALAEAAAARQRARSGRRLSPLDGVPVSWKDLFDTAGTATEAGSALLKGRVPSEDAEVLKVATAMGLVCLGKTHMSELAFSGLGLNPVTQTPPCVNDPDAVAGGSSSGAAASVAFGLAAAAVGSDTGGSVRIPAVWNDLVGLKTTSGRLPLTGVVPLAKRFDTIGPLCRTVEDAAEMLAALEGRAAPDLRGVSLEGRRFAALSTIVMDDIRDAPGDAYSNALDRLANAGARIEKLDVPEVAIPMGDAGPLYTVEAWAEWGDTISADPEAMFAPIRERFEAGRAFSGADYLRALDRMARARAAWAAATAGFDAVLCPTSASLPPDAARLLSDPAYHVRENLLALRNTRVGNVMGLCVTTLPTGIRSCGISLMCPPGDEDRLLRLSAAAERALA
ncbi:amidase [Salipiger sp.]|uniref:amidase n=1 Tax=Salipiger sp. TaxID=2078585 RepID=UPI003A9859AC